MFVEKEVIANDPNGFYIANGTIELDGVDEEVQVHRWQKGHELVFYFKYDDAQQLWDEQSCGNISHSDT